MGQVEASWEVERTQHLLNAQELRVVTDVRMRFYEALVAQRQLELTSQLAEISGRFSSLSAQLLQAQQLSQSDLLQAEVETEELSLWLRLLAGAWFSPVATRA